MKISELKQPYRRMAEYLEKITAIQQSGDGIYNFYMQGSVMDLFCNSMNKGSYKPITEEIKSHFPTNFDFSGEEKNPLTEISVTDLKPIDENLQKAIYTKLAKEGKFDELPETCEFSEPVELEVWDGVMQKFLKLISGKYRGLYMDLEFQAWDYAQIPTPKIDFSDYKIGDVVEIELKGGDYFYGEIRLINEDLIKITISKVSEMTTILGLQNIKSIKKLK